MRREGALALALALALAPMQRTTEGDARADSQRTAGGLRLVVEVREANLEVLLRRVVEQHDAVLEYHDDPAALPEADLRSLDRRTRDGRERRHGSRHGRRRRRVLDALAAEGRRARLQGRQRRRAARRAAARTRVAARRVAGRRRGHSWRARRRASRWRLIARQSIQTALTRVAW